MRIAEAHRQISNVFWRMAPIGVVVVFLSYAVAEQVVSPHHRVIKALMVFLVAAIIWRFEVILALYVFVVIFPVPSGVAITSTNVALMTLIFLFWVIRANARRLRILPRTPLDRLLVLFIGAYLVSLFNVHSLVGISEGLKIIWRQLAAMAFFYLIVLSVDDEAKLEMFTKVVAISAGFLAFTAVIELIAPGSTIIPGWIQLHKRIGLGTIGYRLQGIRVGGAVGSHGLLSDYCTLSLFFMAVHFARARNVLTKLLWLLLTGMTLIVLMATANRGAFLALVFGVCYSLWVFRSRMNLARYIVVVGSFVGLFMVAQLILERNAIAVSVIDRLLHTQMVGYVPETRAGMYPKLLERCMEHIFIGHGPHFAIGAGLQKLMWPHNGYLFFLFTLGLLGFGCFLAICYRLIRVSLSFTRKAIRNTDLGMIAAVLHVQLVVLLIVQLRTDHQRDGDFVYIFIVWMFFGLVVAAYNVIQRRLAELKAQAAPEPPVAVLTPAD